MDSYFENGVLVVAESRTLYKREANNEIVKEEMRLIEKYRKLNNAGKTKANVYLDDLISSGRYNV